MFLQAWSCGCIAAFTFTDLTASNIKKEGRLQPVDSSGRCGCSICCSPRMIIEATSYCKRICHELLIGSEGCWRLGKEGALARFTQAKDVGLGTSQPPVLLRMFRTIGRHTAAHAVARKYYRDSQEVESKPHALFAVVQEACPFSLPTPQSASTYSFKQP